MRSRTRVCLAFTLITIEDILRVHLGHSDFAQIGEEGVAARQLEALGSGGELRGSLVFRERVHGCDAAACCRLIGIRLEDFSQRADAEP